MVQYTTNKYLSYKRNSGFTLLEVMIAIAILATAFVTLLGTQARTISLATETAFQLEAPILAATKLAEYQSNLAELINKNGTFENAPAYNWNLEVETYQLTGLEVADNNNVQLKRIKLDISLTETNYTYNLTYYHYLNVSGDS